MDRAYTIKAPLSTHFRSATCAEVDCPNYRQGWKVRTDGLSQQMLHTAMNSGRKFSWLHVSEQENWLVFEAGQPCFESQRHRKRLEREELFVVRDGRSTPVRHTRPELWMEDLHEHTDKLAEARKEG